jgi:hypothetical protein
MIAIDSGLAVDFDYRGFDQIAILNNDLREWRGRIE